MSAGGAIRAFLAQFWVNPMMLSGALKMTIYFLYLKTQKPSNISVN
jgi:hypothetical protein